MKKTFLLIEVLVAIALVTLCLVPLIQRPLQSYRTEKALLFEMEGERLAEWTFSEVKEKFLKNEIPWSRIPRPGMVSQPISLPKATISLPGQKDMIVERTFTMKCGKRGEKTSGQGDCYRLLRIEITFTPQLSKKKRGTYGYRLLVRQVQSLERER